VAFQLPVAFPSEPVALRRRLKRLQGATAEDRLRIADDLCVTLKVLGNAGDVRDGHLKSHLRAEKAWRDVMTEFIRKHGHHD
jgi:hypothetical protein